MKENPLVSVIVLNYNAGKLLLNCVESLIKFTYKNIEIIVVDNTSDDNSQIECKKKFPQIKLIQNKKNIGYCGGNNVGIKEALGEFVLILNPDTIVDSNLISVLVDAYKTNGDGLYQPKILSLENKKIIQSSGNMIHIFGFGFAKDKGKLDTEQNNKIIPIGYAAGTCLFSAKEIFEKLQLFDEFLFLYHDDLDLGWRASQRGIKSFLVPKTKIYHAESYVLKWSKKKFFWLERNRKYCLMTHYSKKTIKKIRFHLWIIEFFIWIIYLTKGFLDVKIKAELDLWKNKELIRKKQVEIENGKLISDEELIAQFPDTIEVPENVSKGFQSKWFLKILEKFSVNAKNVIRES